MSCLSERTVKQQLLLSIAILTLIKNTVNHSCNKVQKCSNYFIKLAKISNILQNISNICQNVVCTLKIALTHESNEWFCSTFPNQYSATVSKF